MNPASLQVLFSCEHTKSARLIRRADDDLIVGHSLLEAFQAPPLPHGQVVLPHLDLLPQLLDTEVIQLGCPLPPDLYQGLHLDAAGLGQGYTLILLHLRGFPPAKIQVLIVEIIYQLALPLLPFRFLHDPLVLFIYGLFFHSDPLNHFLTNVRVKLLTHTLLKLSKELLLRHHGSYCILGVL